MTFVIYHYKERPAPMDPVGWKFRQWAIPVRMMPGLERYILDGIRPGEFLQALLRNDMAEACGRADPENLSNLPAFVAFLDGEAPPECWGSRAKVEAWIAAKQKERDDWRK